MEANSKIPKSKGKEKAETSTPENTSTDTNAATSLGTRIANSAKGLFQDAIAPGADTAQTLSSSSAFGDKVRGPGSTSTAIGPLQDFASNQRNGNGSIRPLTRRTDGVQESFRTQSTNERNEQDFANFCSTNPGLEANNALKTRELEASWDFLTRTASERALESLQRHDHTDYDDGAEVRALLADPNFDAHTEDELASLDQGPEQSINDLFPQNFSAEDQSTMNQFRASLPQPPVHRRTNPNHPLSLRPRSDEENQAIEENIENILNGSFDAQQTSADLHGEEWLDSWIGVLNGYADEVWGDMLPVVRETKAQLEEVKKGEVQIDNKAVARLKMILGHLEMNR